MVCVADSSVGQDLLGAVGGQVLIVGIAAAPVDLSLVVILDGSCAREVGRIGRSSREGGGAALVPHFAAFLETLVPGHTLLLRHQSAGLGVTPMVLNIQLDLKGIPKLKTNF